MAIKLDLDNSFDRLRHSFILMVLNKFGFPPIFINQVQAYINSPWIAPLINGWPSDFFKASRGIRQGCPLSPFLYILVADSLSRRLTRLQAEGSLLGLSFRNGVLPINHALFADDTILLGIASPQIARNFLWPLDLFLRTSGSSTNLNKCQLYGWNCNAAYHIFCISMPLIIGLISLIWAFPYPKRPLPLLCGLRSSKRSKIKSTLWAQSG